MFLPTIRKIAIFVALLVFGVAVTSAQSGVSGSPVGANQPTLTCPAGTIELFRTPVDFVQLAFNGGPESRTYSVDSVTADNVILSVYSIVGHPEQGCQVGDQGGADTGIKWCDQTNQRHEEFTVSLAGQTFGPFLDGGTDGFISFPTQAVGNLDGSYSMDVDHVGNLDGGSDAESVGYEILICGEEPQEEGGQGCTLGYWKNHEEDWVGYTTGQTFGSVFSGAHAALANNTLLEALDNGGGPGVEGAERTLGRQAVAALLNITNSGISYPEYSEAGLIAAVNAALASDNRGQILDLATKLDGYNNLHNNAVCGD